MAGDSNFPINNFDPFLSTDSAGIFKLLVLCPHCGNSFSLYCKKCATVYCLDCTRAAHMTKPIMDGKEHVLRWVLWKKKAVEEWGDLGEHSFTFEDLDLLYSDNKNY